MRRAATTISADTSSDESEYHTACGDFLIRVMLRIAFIYFHAKSYLWPVRNRWSHSKAL
jgi:hypothetical protein